MPAVDAIVQSTRVLVISINCRRTTLQYVTRATAYPTGEDVVQDRTD